MEKQQEYWGSLPAWYFFLAAMGAMLFVIVAVTDLAGNEIAGHINGWAGLVSFAVAVVGALLLLIELTHKSRGHLVNARPFASVMSFGSLLQSLYIPLVFVYATFFFSFIPWAGLVWLKTMVAVLAIITALLYVTYPGIELGEAKGRSFWNGGGLMGVFLINGAATGAAALILLLLVLGYAEHAYTATISGLAAGLLLAQLLTVPGYVLGMKLSSAEEARRGANKLWNGEFRKTFWGGVIILGTVMPLLINLLFSSIYWLVIAAVLILVGGICFRIDFLRAAVRVVLPGEERAEMSKEEITKLAAALETRWQEKACWLNPHK
ncbi:MAG: Polysulfide reductase, NrfD [Sporomusa sp.]|jgi:formate-dependent nitrite reductase membrane component NrfD|nr:Polysulfide reductase, NrfD [Sporomusa sp.]